MREALERTKAALDFALGVLGACVRHMETPSWGDTVALDIETAKRMAAPPEEFEEVEVVRWYNIYPLTDGFHLDCTHGFATREGADNDAGIDCIGCQEIRVKVKRPVKIPVVREVVRENVSITDQGEIYGNATFWKHAECHGKTVTLIARWTE